MTSAAAPRYPSGVREDSRGGVIIGRFMPLHAGHEYLIRFARAYCTEVTVFVCTLASEPIPGDLRFAWMSRLFPDVNLVHVTEEIPQASRSQAGASRIWADAMRSRIDHDPRYVFASEEYGTDLAHALGAEFVPVDPQRSVFPVSAGMIREDPFAHWRYIPPPVRPYFAKKVVVHDASGALVPELARRWHTVHATDYAAYARSLELHHSHPRRADELARAQAASEAALLESANRVLFAPTDAAHILVSAGASEAETDRALDRLAADHATLAPALVVAAEPVPEAYRRAVERLGWRFEEAGDAEQARSRVDAYLESVFGPT